MAVTKQARPGWVVRLASGSGVHYAWVVVGVTLLAMLVSAGLRQAPGVVIKPLELEFGWNRAETAAAVAVSLFTYGLAGPFAGRLMDRLGVRRVMLGGILLTAFGSAATIFMTTLVEMHLWWGVVVGLGSGALATVMGASVANRWFVAKRGFVTGLLAAGISAGQLVFVPAMMGLTLAFGWRAALLPLAALLALAVLPLAALLMRSDPADVGLRPYGAVASTAAPTAAGPVTPLAKALRSRDFWLLAGSFFVCGFTTNGLIGTHLIPHAVEHGFTEYEAAGALALVGAMNVVGTTASGYLTDRHDPRRLLAIYYGLRAVSLVFLPWVHDGLGLSIFAIVYGVDFIATVPPTVALTADRFGRRSIGTIFGWVFFSHQLGAAAAAAGAGVVRVWMGDYAAAFLAAALLGFVAAAVCLRITPPSRMGALAARSVSY
ncbi:MAG: MFS transporter [Chloroflexi bacterium]|nr:MFS transporter [Chloroflexota bacterium]